MKNSILYSLLLLCAVASCSTDEDFLPAPSNTKSLTNRICPTEAKEFADKYVKRKANTRQSSPYLNNESLEYEYILSSRKTRTNSLIPDTLAYIINYPNNGGFAIIATDARAYPILAYSEEGNFDTDCEIVNDNFIIQIETYLEDAIENNDSTRYTVEDIDANLETCFYIAPQANIQLNQNSPYNKYVNIEHPGYPTGCVPVAAALVLTHTQWCLYYHDEQFFGNSITQAIRKKVFASAAPQRAKQNIVGSYEPTYTYDEAVDKMAKLLYWLGKDINIRFRVNSNGTKEAAASSEDVYTLFQKMGLKFQSGFVGFNLYDIAMHITNHCMIYLTGRDGKAGHAWVADGVEYCYEHLDTSKPINIMIHCDWGWGGKNNGFYSGSVFNAGNYNFTVNKYFAVKSELF